MELVTVLLSVVIILFLVKVFSNQKDGKYKNFPPGPKPLPILGNILMVDMSKPHKTLFQLSKEYGTIFSVHLGMTKMVVLCGYDTIKDALVNHAEFFSDRPHNPLFSKSIKEHGIVFANGENWKVMRRFTLSTLRDYGMGKKTIENRIVEEAECLIQKLKSYEGKPFSNFTSLNAAVTNIIVALLLNKRFDYEDPTILRLMGLVSENIKLLGSPWVRLYNSFPSIMDRLPGPHRTIFKNLKEFQNFIIVTFTKYKKELDVNDQRNLVDAFLTKQQEGNQESTQYYHNENLTVLVGDLFGAGMETTSTTLRWAILLMAKYPEIQKKVQSEIDKVIGSAQPQMEHRKQMAYTDAVIHEIQRFGDIAPTTVPHVASRDVTFRGYFIPKGTPILPILHSIHKDKEYFQKPDEFYPEHFLDSEGNFKKNEAFIPFSIEVTSSMELVTVLLSLVVVLFLVHVFRNQKDGKCKNFPPGPKPLPILGNILMLDMLKPHKTFFQLSKEYGTIFSVHMGMTKMVVLCSYDTIKDALVNHAEVFSDRPYIPLFSKSTKNHGIFFANGENWKVMRRFALSTLRDYGMGKKTMENRISEEAMCLVQKLKSYEGKPFSNFTSLNAAVTNIIVALLLNKRFDYEDPTILRLMGLVSENIKLLGSPWVRLYNSFPSIMNWLPGPHRTFLKNLREFQNFITVTFTKYKKEVDVNQQRNLVDAFLAKQQEGKQESTQYYHNENLTALVADLFGAGMETTSTTLRWGLLLMAKYPEIQKKVQNEIDKVIGLAQPQMEHRKQMAYTDAVIHEIQRFGDIASSTVPHVVSQDVTFRGYFIPKGTPIIPVLHSIHRDKEYFQKPNEFYPEHFLDSEGNFKKIEAFIPFSIGRRRCTGESLAKMELFLFFTSLLQQLTFKAQSAAELDLTPALGSLNSPKPFAICAIPRS